MTHEKSVTDLVTVYVAHGLLRANVIQGLLESAGIPVMLSYESLGHVIGVTMTSLGSVEIKVPEKWEQEALDLLNAEPRTGEIFSVPPDVTEDDTTT
jgi:putative signal transducing protein